MYRFVPGGWNDTFSTRGGLTSSSTFKGCISAGTSVEHGSKEKILKRNRILYYKIGSWFLLDIGGQDIIFSVITIYTKSATNLNARVDHIRQLTDNEIYMPHSVVSFFSQTDAKCSARVLFPPGNLELRRVLCRNKVVKIHVK